MKKQILAIILISFSTAVFPQFTVIGGDSTSFETNASLAQIDTVGGNSWQVGTPQKAFFGVSYSAPFSIMTDSLNPYPVNNLSQFTAQIYDTAMTGPGWGFIPSIQLGFWHKYETDSLVDGGYIEVSVDSGATWQQIFDPYADFMVLPFPNFYTPYDTIRDSIPGFSGSLTAWSYSGCRLQFVFPAFAPADPRIMDVFTQRVMLRFSFKSDNTNTNKAGWIIDDLCIREYDVGGGIHDLAKPTFSVEIFPNPSAGEGILQVIPFGPEDEYLITISDLSGRTILTSPADRDLQLKINSGMLQSGFYLYTVTSDTGATRSGKFIIK